MVKPEKNPKIAHLTVFMSYFKAVEILLKTPDSTLNITIVYLFKHCLELISRALIDPEWKHHSLRSFSNEIMKKYPVLRKWEELEINLTDGGLIDFKMRVLKHVAGRKDLLEKHGLENVLKVTDWIKPPCINVKHLYEILEKYDFWDVNNTYFRYLDNLPDKVGNFSNIEEIIEAIRGDFDFLEKCQTFLSFIFMGEFKKINLKK